MDSTETSTTTSASSTEADEVSYHAGGHSYTEVPTITPSYLLVWDAPNMDMCLGSIVGGRPSSAQRPRFDAIASWLVKKADRHAARHLETAAAPEATVFTNITPGSHESLRGWIDALRTMGFAVFAKPKLAEDTDVDPDMVAHIRRRVDEGMLRGLVVASADGANFQELLEDLAETIPVTVISFREHATWAHMSPVIDFVDLEDIPHTFGAPLPRVNLDNLPDEGAWLQPYRPLRTLTNRGNQRN